MATRHGVHPPVDVCGALLLASLVGMLVGRRVSRRLSQAAVQRSFAWMVVQ